MEKFPPNPNPVTITGFVCSSDDVSPQSSQGSALPRLTSLLSLQLVQLSSSGASSRLAHQRSAHTDDLAEDDDAFDEDDDDDEDDDALSRPIRHSCGPPSDKLRRSVSVPVPIPSTL